MISILITIKNKIYSILIKTKLFAYKNKKLENSFRKRLTNDNFTILCPNCIGGTIYHRLGKQFLSPTINLWMNHSDFSKFVSKTNYYVSLDLDFIESDEKTPVAMLGDIKLHFNHSKSNEEASIDWNRRKGRINYDNLYIIAYDVDGVSNDEDINIIKSINCKGVVILTDKKEKSDEEVYIKPTKAPDDFLFLGKDIFGIRTFEKQWDFVSFLNQ